MPFCPRATTGRIGFRVICFEKPRCSAVHSGLSGPVSPYAGRASGVGSARHRGPRRPAMSRLLRVGCLIVLALPLPAQAQAERFELGQRLRAFEGAWDEHPDPAGRQRAVAPLKRAVTAFFAFRLPEAGSALDE